MPNPKGQNGQNNGIQPPDDILRTVLFDFARRNLSNDARVAELSARFGYNIGTRKLMRLNKEFDVPSKRKLPAAPVVISRVMEKVNQDEAMRNSPQAIADQLRSDPFKETFPVGRDQVRRIMWANEPEGSAIRQPGYKHPVIECGVITTTALQMEVHFDGHEKLSFQALSLGDGIGVPIYGGREQLSGRIGVLKAVPNDRNNVVIGHCFLDHIEASQNLMSVQATMDKGTEVGWIIHLQEELRRRLMPDLDCNEFPSFVNIPSTRNVIIEGLWHWFRKSYGLNMKALLLKEKADGVFIPGNMLHTNLFRWLWPKIIQRVLDQFRAYWNLHKIRKQADKPNPSGASPDDIWSHHAAFGYPSVGAWTLIGRPELVPQHGWDIFGTMLMYLEG
ncbi:hypothetical protein BD626DRAFT_545803 [Schizophyllum amplum]|uniref:Uncharacterized protein n=1 Tax=Schizophyllum amplum TaxID=97359 RepID=A0A550CPC9_9AGAR|nr:hypothetical protein BD626DRAFT_545803 [Auriculariopsis ampla]